MGLIQLIILYILLVIGVYRTLKWVQRIYFKYRWLTPKEKRDIIITDHNYLYRVGINDNWKYETDDVADWSNDGYQID